MESGWIKLYRNLLHWRWYSDPSVTRVFIHLLLRAVHEPTPYRDRMLKPGQLANTIPALAGEITMSIQTIRTALDKLLKTGEIKIEATNKFSVITVVNYMKWQENRRSSNIQPTNNNGDDQQTTLPKSNKQKPTQSTNKTSRNQQTKRSIKSTAGVGFSRLSTDPTNIQSQTLLANDNGENQHAKSGKGNTQKSTRSTNKTTDLGGLIGGDKSPLRKKDGKKPRREDAKTQDVKMERRRDVKTSPNPIPSSLCLLPKKEDVDNFSPHQGDAASPHQEEGKDAKTVGRQDDQTPSSEDGKKGIGQAFVPIASSWWPSRAVCSAMTEGGFPDTAIQTIRMRLINTVNRNKYFYPDLNKAFCNFAKTYAYSEGQRNGLTDEQIEDWLKPLTTLVKKTWGR